jgi:hypothetical protein
VGGFAIPGDRLPALFGAGGCLASLAAGLALWSGSAEIVAGADEASLGQQVAQTPLAFEPDAGRTDGGFDYIARSVAGGSLYLTAREAVLSLPAGGRDPEDLRLAFAGADPAAEAVALDGLPGKVNSFIGDDPSKWRSGIPTYGRVRYESIYPGIDVDYYGNQRDLEYDFRVAAGADPSQIAVEMSGASSLRLSQDGDLLLGVGKTTVRQRAPIAYQRIAGERRPVSASYALDGSTVGFRLGGYDRARPLVIDPVVLAYSTHLGGTDGGDTGHSIVLDAAGAAYVAGETGSTNFPTQRAYQPNLTTTDAFVTKFNPDNGGAVTLAYSTYLGGGGADLGLGVAVDPTGAAYVVGETTSTDFPTQDPFQTDQAAKDAFATKLNPDTGGAVTLAYSTYLGGSSSETARGIAVDSAGAAYLTGDTGSDFPLQDSFLANPPGFDAFVTKLNPDSGAAVTLAYSTYLGADDADGGYAIAVDSAGAAYVTGVAFGTGFPTQDPFQGNQGGIDGFVTKFNPDPGGTVTLAYSTYLGGGSLDEGFGIAVDSSGAAYVTGETDSTDFPTQDPLQGDQGIRDAFVTKVDPDSGGAATLAYSTYLGGADGDVANAIAVDPSGAAYVTGVTGSADFPAQQSLQDYAGNGDAFATRLDPDAGGAVALGYSTFLGGATADVGRGVAADSTGKAYLTGYTDSANFPVQDQFQGPQGSTDAFVTSLEVTPEATQPDTDPPETAITKGPKKKTKKKKVTFEFVSDEPGSSFQCKLDRGAFEPCASPDKVKAKKKGKHNFEVRAVDAAGNADASPASHSWKRKKKRRRR